MFPDIAVGLVHGRMKPAEKDQAMSRFRRGETPILVATTVIEVGVDVPNATVMVIEDANRFGLAQLHQLRGRVGRGHYNGHCFLLTDERFNPALSSRGDVLLNEDPDAEIARRRMRIMTDTCDGFRIAEEDFEMRGVGVYFGTAQHGRSKLRLADLRRDFDLVQTAREAAFDVIAADPHLQQPDHVGLRQLIKDVHIEYDIQEDYTSVA